MKCFVMLLWIFLLISCSHKEEVTKVSVGISGAWSYRGGAISIDSSGKYQYFGGINRLDTAQNYYTGKFSRTQLDTLLTQLDSIDLKKVDSTAIMNAFDVSYYELIVHFKNDKKRIVRAGAYNSEPVSHLLTWLQQSYKHVKLKQTKAPIEFETTFQNGVGSHDPNEKKIMGD